MPEKKTETSPLVAAIDELMLLRAAPTRGRKALPYVTLAILLALSLLAWQHFENLAERRSRSDFDEYAEAMTSALRRRLADYEMIMQGGAGLFISSTDVTRKEWSNYVRFRRVQERFPGIQALGVVRHLHNSDLQSHQEEIRAKEIADYRIFPPGEREEYSPLIFVEPLDEVTRPIIGFDLMSEPKRRAALELAVSTGNCAISEKITLAQGFAKFNGPGFLLCLPIYEVEKPLLTVEERRATLWGYVISAFHMEDLVRGLFPNTSHKIEFEIFDGDTPDRATLMYDSHASSNNCLDARFSANKVLDLYGRQWTILFHTTPIFDSQADDRLPSTLLAGSIVISLLIFLFLKMLEGTGERALDLARKLTHELEEDRAWLDTVINTAMDAIIAMNNIGEIMVWNSSAVRMFGHTEEEAMGKDLQQLIIPARVYDAETKGLSLIKNDGGSSIYGLSREIIAKRKNGEEFNVEITMSARKKDENAGIVAVIRDITERKKVQAQIAAERQRLYNVLETLPAFVALIGPDHSLPYVNRQFREQFGDPAGRLWHEILFDKEQQCDNCRTQDVFLTGSPEFWELTEPDGRIYQIHDYPYTDSDGTLLVLELGLDITDQKQIESERIARHAAEAANHQKSLFLSNMSHEIRTPMNAILGFAQILERDPNLSAKQHEQIRSINRSGQHLLALINDILDMSKIEAGMHVLKPAAFSLHDLIDDLTMMFRSRAEAKNLQFALERDASVPYYVIADEGKIRQVLINLLGNAIKFTESGGVSMRVRISTPSSPANEDTKQLKLTIEVEDSGPGIPDSDIEGIFTPFRQGEAGSFAGGTGLGLAISHRLAEMMGGSITVKTSVGRGSCFRFDTNIEPTDAVARKKSPAPRLVAGLEPGTGPFRILVVDDIQINRALLCDLLRPLGFEIRQAENGATALEIFDEWDPHAVLMDMRMPVMDGYEATRRIKATTKGQNIPVIAVTASAFKDSEDQVMATGVSAYLRKPFRPEELWTILGECLGLRYVYTSDAPAKRKDETPTQLENASPKLVAALPENLLHAMRQAVEEGDMTKLVELIDQVAPQNAEIAKALRDLADRYDYERLVNLLEQRGNTNA